jgi:hypothetical protein
MTCFFGSLAISLKKSEEGLDQNFNSLHAQREACEAFIKSQASEGWRLVKTHYDGGGVSGASIERQALQQLPGDIRQGLFEVVVVYKVDRLTRSLADFAKWSSCSMRITSPRSAASLLPCFIFELRNDATTGCRFVVTRWRSEVNSNCRTAF